MKIYIVRHGETNGNLRGVLQGWTDEPLNEKGRELAIITAQALSDIKFDVAISSPLSRAYETVEIILRENKRTVPQIQTDDRLKEMFFGEWEGLGLTEEKFEIPSEHFNDFYENPFAFENSESGESVQQVCARTSEFYQELITRPELQNKTILLTTHGFALRAMLQQVYENNEDFWHGKVPDNCAVNIIEVKDGKSVLVGDDVIYYDPNLCVNHYKPV
ncbi:MAG: histidine phosphatase family protein [Lachnospira sp.]